ncbi:MAG: hypothetical protein DSZ28_06670 [Thiothrix sp.]|nr:MAG: hypothetical protein DSZ28_06670 [Thiothrix sp.]
MSVQRQITSSELAFATIALLGFCQTLFAEPSVLYDSGNSMPVEQYGGDVSTARSPQTPAYKSTAKHNLSSPAKEAQINNIDASVLPLRTHGMSVGKVIKRQVNIPALKTPVCVVGSDEQSLNWLATNRKQLSRIGARCLLIQAESQTDIDRVNKQANGLKMVTVPGDAMVAEFGLQHYPVLISKRWIEQ